ncbi:hypothetical protein [Thiothrix nivea]|uniref:Uncharacterized protein n=1 Tax=Thiothrix nivea (strain ATCC 35100 / DSM 5205 / JP2) TaxID=870187 RepID=A0A656HI18_THINJ|nr:hypothetical protein [Thiothrix nivea]EIJ35136.1 hypothetical protein Thini_2596 [Thiothrix nivea DSM 5205]
MKPVLMLCAGLLLMQPALANDPDSITQFNNSACNTPELTDPATSGIANHAQLDQKVRGCDRDNHIYWYEDQIQDIVGYIAQKYYNNFQ